MDIELRNLLSFGDEVEKISFDDISTIVGPNDSGKTNIFRAISFVNDCLNTNTVNPESYYPNGDFTKDFEIKLSVELHDKEIESLTNFIFCSILSENPNTSGSERPDRAIRLMEKLLTEHCKTISQYLFKHMTIIIRRAELRDIYKGDILIKLGNDRELYLRSHVQITKSLSSNISTKNLSDKIISLIRNKNRTKVNSYFFGESEIFPEFNFSQDEIQNIFFEFDLKENIDGYEIKAFDILNSNLRARKYPQVIFLQNFLRELNMLGNRQFTIFEIIARIFHNSLIRTSNLRSEPHSFLNLENSIQNESINMNNLRGTILPDVLFRLRNSKYPSIRRRYNEIQKSFSALCNGLEFEILLQPTEVVLGKNARKTPINTIQKNQEIKTVVVDEEKRTSNENELIIHFVKGNVSISLDFSSAGRFEILLLITALIGQEEKVILLDEPAINLHPILQRKILEIIERVSKDNGNQIILITHSPYLINTQHIANVWRVASVKGHSKLINVGQSISELDAPEREKIIKNFQYSDIRSVFFSKGAILVEGLSDKLVIEQVDRFLSSKNKGANIDENDWYVLEMDGKHSLWAYVKMMNKLNLPYVAVMDYDALMQCDKNIKIENNSNASTSAIINNLHSLELLSVEDLEKIKRIDNSKGSWYPQSQYEILDKITSSHGIFVFKTNLEGVLQTPVKRNDSKPLKDLNTLLQKISEDKLPKEFEEMSIFIKNAIENNSHI